MNKEMNPLQQWLYNYRYYHPEYTVKYVAEQMKVSSSMVTYLCSGERELTLERFNSLCAALRIKHGTKAHKELLEARRHMNHTVNIRIPSSVPYEVRDSLDEFILKHNLISTTIRK